MNILKATMAISLLILTTMNTKAQNTQWEIDPAHSNISFSISHFTIATVKGTFDSFKGTLKSDEDNFDNAQLSVVIEANSINTNQDARDKHLRSDDFLGVEKKPKITFESTLFEKEGENKYKVHGIFTMNGVAKNLTLTATYKGSFEHPQFKKTIGVFEIQADIPRLDFKVGQDYPNAVLGETVKLNSTVELTKL